MQRAFQVILIASTLLGSWLGMQAIHEGGHVLGAWSTGGRVARVVLSPLTLSRTDVAVNPHPLLVVWAGPIVGVLAPLLLWAGLRSTRWAGVFVARFFAGFCLLANGLYIAVGSFGRIGDSGEMLRLGSPIWLLWLFGLVTAPFGLLLWNGQGSHFGLGPAGGQVDRRVTLVTAALCGLLLLVGFLVGGE